MGEEQGYDDQFNDGLFRTTLHASRRQRPHMWPKSVSEMRHHTSYDGQGMPRDYDTAYSDYMERRPYYRQATWYRPFWHEPSHPRMQPWQGYLAPVDPRAWSWHDNSAH